MTASGLRFIGAVSPRFDGGSGLKRVPVVPAVPTITRLPSFRRGERIETRRNWSDWPMCQVSPRFDGGSGLKLTSLSASTKIPPVSPRFDGGSGLKHQVPDAIVASLRSPLVSTGGAD